MRFIYSITHALLQGSLTSFMVYTWGLVTTWNIVQAALSTGALVLFLGLYGIIFGILLYKRTDGIQKIFIVSVMSSLLTTLTFFIYPELGLSFEWWVLLFILLFASGISHALLYGLNQEAIKQSDKYN